MTQYIKISMKNDWGIYKLTNKTYNILYSSTHWSRPVPKKDLDAVIRCGYTIESFKTLEEAKAKTI
jgi:hypothetical protein